MVSKLEFRVVKNGRNVILLTTAHDVVFKIIYRLLESIINISINNTL
jgi:hypothetical protein